MPRSHKPVSPKQLAANRANAQKSTGPKTPEGKARSSKNATKHGLTAANRAIVYWEDSQETARLQADLTALYKPVNSQERFAIERMALSQQSILRAARLESGLFTRCLSQAVSPDEVEGRNFNFAEGFLRHTNQSNGHSLFLRYQAQAERQYRRALEEFNRLKSLRPQLPNEPVHPGQAVASTCPRPTPTPQPLQNPIAAGSKHQSNPAPTPVHVSNPPQPQANCSSPDPCAVSPRPTVICISPFPLSARFQPAA